MGWEIYPEGLAETVRWLHERCRFPRYLITENGAAMDDQPDAAGFVDDQDRIGYLRDHLAVIHELIDEGLPIDGYFAWSLMDNFEWAYGYTERFGLIRVDYDTLERTPKASARWYADVTRRPRVLGDAVEGVDDREDVAERDVVDGDEVGQLSLALALLGARQEDLAVVDELGVGDQRGEAGEPVVEE